MTIQLGLFDVFTYTIPGSLYLALISYIGERLGWFDIANLKNVPSLVLIGGLLICSYIVGFVADPVAAQLDRWLRHWKAKYHGHARETFKEQVPSAGTRSYAMADLYLLLALAETTYKEAALEISRLRATGLMLRNCSVPFLFASVVSIVEAAIGSRPLLAALCALLFAGAVLSCIFQGKRLRVWADMKTLQICYWIPGIDNMILHPERGGS
jgi:hypothetical protein